jgi:tetratricopeptide (TPR) repeat protein
MRRTSLAVLGLVTALQWSAAAAPATDNDTCTNGSGDAAIAACDRMIAAGGDARTYVKRGLQYFRKGEYDRAIRDYDEAIRLNPKDPIAFNNRGDTYAHKGDTDRAIRDFDEVIRLDPKIAIAFSNRGVLYGRKGDNDRAIRDHEEAIRLDPKDAISLHYRGIAYANKGESDRAIRDYDEAIRLDPKFAAALESRGNAYLKKGDNDRAIRDLDEAIRLDPRFGVALTRRGMAREAKGDREGARADFAAALALPVTDSRGKWAQDTARARLAALAPAVATPAPLAKDDETCLKGSGDDAIAACGRLIASGGSARTYYNRAAQYARKRDFDRAIPDYDEAIRLDPKYVQAYNGRGWAYARKGDNDRAIRDHDEAIRLNPNDAVSFHYRGMVHDDKGDLDRAIRDYDETIRLNPKSAGAFENRGIAHLQKGDNDRAIRDFDEAIRLNPKLVVATENRGIAYFQKGDHERAMRDYNEAIRLDPRYGAAFTRRGIAREAKGDREGARADFNAALALPLTNGRSKWAQDTARTRLAALGPAAPPPPRRVALVIGNGAYTGMPRLKNPANDANDIAAQLKTLGFEVTLGIDLARNPFEETLIRFAREARQSEVALIFYAGHGLQHNGVNYLLPVDARIEEESDLRRLIQLQSVLDDLRAAKGIRILILDACRDNGVVQRIAAVSPTRSAAFDRGLSRLDQTTARGAFVVYATQPNVVAKDGEGRNSPFTSALLKHMATPGLELRSVMTRVRADVVRDSGGAQWPEVSDSLIGELVMKATQ